MYVIYTHDVMDYMIYMDIHGYTCVHGTIFVSFFLVYSKVPDGDILIHCGDMTNRGSAPELQEVNAWLEERGSAMEVLVHFFMTPQGLWNR